MATNPHIYVSSVHGTNTGATDTSYAAQQTGNITSLTAANVYDNIGSAIAGTAPTAGDVIYVASNHAAAYNNGTFISIPEGVHIYSVDDTNIDQYEPGASEHLTDTADIYYFNDKMLLAGVSFETGADVFRATGNEPHVRMIDATITVDSVGDDAIYLARDGGSVELVNVDVAANGVTAGAFTISLAGVITWRGGAVTTNMNQLISAMGGAGGGFIYVEGVDLSLVGQLHFNQGSSQDNTLAKFTNCLIKSSVVLPSTASFGRSGQRFEMYNCDDATGDALYRFLIADYSGTAKNNDSVYVTNTDPWYGGTDKSSIEVQTSANCSHAAPFVFELPAQIIDLSQAASDKITIELLMENTLTDTDIAGFLVYPDAVAAVKPNWATSGKTVGTGNYGIDPLAAGTALPSSSLGAADWTGEGIIISQEYRKIEIDTSADAGQLTVAAIRIEVYKPSILAGDLFIHPIVSVS